MWKELLTHEHPSTAKKTFQPDYQAITGLEALMGSQVEKDQNKTKASLAILKWPEFFWKGKLSCSALDVDATSLAIKWHPGPEGDSFRLKYVFSQPRKRGGSGEIHRTGRCEDERKGR